MFILVAFLIPLLGITGTIYLGIFCAIFGYFYYYVKRQQNVWHQKGIKYCKPKFLLGSLEIIRSKSLAQIIQELYNAFPEERYHGFYQFLLPTLIIKDPDLIKQITIKDFDHFVNHRRFVNADDDPFWSRNLFARRDEKWRDMRATLSPSFTSSKMRIMFELMDECAREFVQHFKSQNSDTVELEMKDTLRRFTNDVIASTAFGLKINSLKDRKNEFLLMGAAATDFGYIRTMKFLLYTLSPKLCQLLKMKIIPTKVADFFTVIIKDTIKKRKEKNIIRPDMIHLLLEAQKGRQHPEEHLDIDEGFSSVSESKLTKPNEKLEITTEDIISQALIFFLAGFDTVSTLLNFLFYELAVNPDVQTRLRTEIQSVDEKITYETLLKLKYLDMVMSEALRKWPPAIATDREVAKNYTIEPTKPDEKPLLLEEGMLCSIPICAIHRDEKYYPEPEKFDPERFNDENKHKINPLTFIPFGAGPRNCIGSRFALLESKLLVFHVVKNFEIVPIDKTLIPLVMDKYQINWSVKGGTWLGLKNI
ncbi:probable cytochrome P450 9f2 [Tribolium castaneum]|uniref:probable cytochrome P450 9f2 n=1 Tax=Tribolium castaneum TaxID=7070 RepID=UPI00046BEF4E|nr:PREDICTED: probable cytochrome P450 9f2 [Tribolium castaneum]|eukprot:XP_008200085.1 PREDICTED: probable cytochrome P450 9f2 [Tribolium castaneum]